MKNHNYDLVKMLFAALDDSYRIEKYYLKDSEACSHCNEVFSKMKQDIDGHVEMLRNEVVRHSKEDAFD
jgi:hypothetical protein